MAYTRNNTINPQTFLRTNAIIHAALIAGQILFALVTIAISKDRAPLKFTLTGNNVFMIIVTALAIVSCIIGRVIFNKLLETAKSKQTLTEKLTIYQSATIIRFALCEGPSLFGIVATMLTLNSAYLIISALLILYMVLLKPSRLRLENDLDLTFEEQEQLN